MNTITGFLSTENNYKLLSIEEMIVIKGGDDPNAGETDPFKKKN